MAKVILSDRPTYQPGNFTRLAAGYHNPLLSSFWSRFWDSAADVVEGTAGLITGSQDSVNQITSGIGTGVGAYMSNPNNIAQVANIATAAATGGFNPGLVNMPLPGQFDFQNQTPQQLLNNPVVLLGGLAILYLVTKK